MKLTGHSTPRTPCRVCNDGSCMLCDDDGLVPDTGGASLAVQPDGSWIVAVPSDDPPGTWRTIAACPTERAARAAARLLRS